jgi:WD40 repeat protein
MVLLIIFVVLVSLFMIPIFARPGYVLYSEKLYDQGTINALACSPDQGFIAVVWGSDCCDIYGFDLKHRLFHFEKVLQHLCSVTFDPGSKRVVTAATGIGELYDLSNGIIYIWDLDPTKPEISLRTNLHQIRDVCLSPDGKIVAAAGGDWEKKGDKRTVQLFDVEKREPIAVLEGHETIANSVTFAPNGNLLASAGAKDRKIILWDWRRRKELAELRIATTVSHLGFSPNGKYLAAWPSGSDGAVLIFDIETMELTSTITSDLVRIGGVSFSADSEVLVIGGGEKGEPGDVQFWRITSESLINTFHYNDTNITSVVCSPDGAYVIASTRDGRVLVLDYKKIVGSD